MVPTGCASSPAREAVSNSYRPAWASSMVANQVLDVQQEARAPPLGVGAEHQMDRVIHKKREALYDHVEVCRMFRDQLTVIVRRGRAAIVLVVILRCYELLNLRQQNALPLRFQRPANAA